MSAFDQAMAAVADGLMAVNGDETVTVRYLDPPNDPVTVTAILGDIETREIEGERQRTRTVTITTDPTGDYGGVANPGTHATVEIDGVEWPIEAVEDRTASLVRIRLVDLALVDARNQEFISE